MSNLKQVDVLPSSTPNRWTRKTCFLLLGRVLKYTLLLMIAAVIWHYVGSGTGKAKLHGALLTPLAALLALQEFLFFQARGRMGEALKTPAFRVRELNQVLERVIGLKAYADHLWFIAVPAKMVGLLAGATLFCGGYPEVLMTVKGHAITGDALLGIAGWFALLIGLDSTWRTFRVFKYVDAKLMELEVESRQIIARKAEADEFKSAKKQNADETSGFAKYPRLKPPKTS